MTGGLPRERGARGAGLLGAILVLGFVLAAAAVLSDYGITWDEGLGDLCFGDVYLEFLKSGCDPSWIPVSGREPRNPAHWGSPGQPDLARSPFRFMPVQHWPVANTIVAAFGEVFDRRLGWLGPIEARHLGVVSLAALALAAAWTFAREVFGVPAAVASVLLLATFPDFFGLAQNVAKDVGECAFYGWTIVAFHRAYTRRSAAWLVLAGILLGLALGTKLNAVFAVVTIALWLALSGLARLREWWPRPDPRPALALLGATAIGCAVFVAAWPWLWPDLFGRLREQTAIIVHVAAGGPDAWQSYPFVELLVRTPLVVAALAGAGLIALVLWPRARRPWPAVLILLLWLLVPLARSAVPGFRNYDGIRRFLEFLPPLMIVAGVGVAAIGEAIARRAPQRIRIAVPWAVSLLAAAQSIWIDARIHPHQTTYLNSWRGDRVPVDYLGNSMRAGVDWLNRNAVHGAEVVAPVAPWLLEIAAPVWLRKDLSVAPSGAVRTVEPGPVPVSVSRPPAEKQVRYVLLLDRPVWSERVKEDLVASGREIHRIAIDGTPILSIFAIGPASARMDGR